jgi:hypothetical protein
MVYEYYTVNYSNKISPQTGLTSPDTTLDVDLSVVKSLPDTTKVSVDLSVVKSLPDTTKVSVDLSVVKSLPDTTKVGVKVKNLPFDTNNAFEYGKITYKRKELKESKTEVTTKPEIQLPIEHSESDENLGGGGRAKKVRTRNGHKRTGKKHKRRSSRKSRRRRRRRH